MNTKKLVTLIVVLVVIVGSIVVILNPFAGPTGPSPIVSENSAKFAEVGQEAIDFTLTDFDGNEVTLSDFRGKPVMLDFWADWCPFCTGEMPEINQVFNEFNGELVVLGIHRSKTEPVEVGREFADGLGIDYTLLQDPTDEVYKVYGRGGNFMPVAAYIDEDGIVSFIKAGPKTADEIREEVTGILNNAN